MYIAMNRFQVRKGAEADFERLWASRESYLSQVDGFIEFNLLKGPEAEDHCLYASHSRWTSRAAFEAWTRSEHFRAAHARAGNASGESLYVGHPRFEGFEVILTERNERA